MATQYTQLPMIECSSCGKILGHLYTPYYKIVTYLTQFSDDGDDEDNLSVHDNLANGNNLVNLSELKLDDKISDRVSTFLDKYYKWLISKYPSDVSNLETMTEWKLLKELYDPKALVSKALLMHRELTDDDLPLHKHERDPDCVRYCCARMLICDNSQANY